MRRLALPLCILLLLATISASAQTPLPEKYRMRAQSQGSIGSTSRIEVEITVERWSDDAERDGLLAVLVESGPEALKAALADLPETGRVQVERRTSYPLQFAREFPQPDGTRLIRVITDRPIGFGEAMSQSRTQEYAFSILEMTVDAEGNGEGVVVVGAEIAFDAEARTIGIKSYDGAMKLTTVHRVE